QTKGPEYWRSLEELAIEPLGSALRELAVHQLAEFLAAGKLLQTAPVLRPLRLLELLPNGHEIQLALFRWANLLAMFFPFVLFHPGDLFHPADVPANGDMYCSW